VLENWGLTDNVATAAGAAVVACEPGVVTITDPDLFAPGQEARTELFARRVLRVPELRTLQIDPASATATLRYRTPFFNAKAVVERFADAVASGEGLDETHLPPWRPGEPVVFYRYGGVVSTLEILSLNRRWLRARHPAIACEPATAKRIEEALWAAPGVLEVAISPTTATIEVRFDPAMATGAALLRVVETTLLALPGLPAVPNPGQPDFISSLVTLGVSAVGEFVVPALLPASAALLVWSNVDTLRAGTEQVRDGKLGLPVLYSSIVVFTLLSSSFFSAAVMFWFFRYWERCYGSDLAEENAALLGEVNTVPAYARVVDTDDVERLVPSSEVEPGQHVRVLAGETIPVDATVVSGAALLNEPAPGARDSPTVRLPGNEVLASRQVLAGRLDLTAVRNAQGSHAAQLGRALLATTIPVSSAWTLTREAEAFATRTVLPTMAAAAGGLLVGGTAATTSILRVDYATGIGLAETLRMLRLNRIAMRHGALVRIRALDHLAADAWIVLDDHAELNEPECDLAEIRVWGLSEEQLFPAIAAAGAWLGDARGPALMRACAARGLIARRAELQDIDKAGVAIKYGRHIVRLCGHQNRATLSPLRVEVDAAEVATLRFRRSDHLPAAVTVRQLQRAGLRVFLASSRAPEDAARIARQLGADAYAGMLDDDSRCNLLRKLQERGDAVLHVRDTAVLPYTRDNYVSIGLAGSQGIRHDADIVLLGRSIAPLPTLVALARDHVAQSRQDRWTIIGLNLASVAGVFAFGLTGLTVVLISNLATYLARDRARQALDEAKADPSVGANVPWSADDVDDISAGRFSAEAPEPEQMRA
jgi:cation transport ATPase